MTARARIREAAIVGFGRNGFSATSIREVAAAAGISAGLVIHHFGGKDGLRRACDDRILELLEKKSTGAPEAVGEVVARLGDYSPYLARMIGDGSDAGNELFDRILAESRAMIVAGVKNGTVRDVGDPPTVALVVTIQSLAPLLLNTQVLRVLGEGRTTGEVLRAIAAPTAKIYTSGLFATDALALAVAEAGNA